MSGVVEKVLTDLFGDARIVQRGAEREYVWEDSDPRLRSVLFVGATNDTRNELRGVYGDFSGGGILVGGSLKLAHLGGQDRRGIYSIEELNEQPEVQLAHEQDSEVLYFLDAANVWFYGVKDGALHVYDAETGEQYELGLLEEALRKLCEEWAHAETQGEV